MQMQQEYGEQGLAVVGVTEVDREMARQFVDDFELNYAVLAEASSTQDAYGVKFVWGSAVYLVDPSGTIEAQGLDSVSEYLRERLGQESR